MKSGKKKIPKPYRFETNDKTKNHAAVINLLTDHILIFWELHSERAQFYPAPSPIPRSRIVEFLRVECGCATSDQIRAHSTIIRALDDGFIDYVVNSREQEARTQARENQADSKGARDRKEEMLRGKGVRGAKK